jgi:hypothetical protein
MTQEDFMEVLPIRHKGFQPTNIRRQLFSVIKKGAAFEGRGIGR